MCPPPGAGRGSTIDDVFRTPRLLGGVATLLSSEQFVVMASRNGEQQILEEYERNTGWRKKNSTS